MKSKEARGQSHAARAGIVALSILSAAVLTGCTSNVRQHGAVVTAEALSQVSVGSSKEQVQLALGTPSTKSSIDGDAFYYISTRIEERAFFAPKATDRRILAIEFDDSARVQRIAEYGLKDGQVFDFTTKTTPTGGERASIIRQILGNTAAGVSTSF